MRQEDREKAVMEPPDHSKMGSHSMKYRLYQAKRRNGKLLPKWKVKYFHDDGAYYKGGTLFTDKGRSRERAEELCREWEKQESEKRAGIPQISDRPIIELMQEYIQIRGEKGKDGHPWTERHRRNTQARLLWWVNTLNLRTLHDITLVGVEKSLSGLSLGGETRNNYFHFLNFFVNWCVRVRYMPYNPLQGFQKFQKVASYSRAAFTIPEIRALLESVPPGRQMVYMMALLTGMRHKELRSLQVADLDLKRMVVKLSASASKNRKEAWLHLPEDFLYQLVKTLEGKGPQAPLLDIGARGAEMVHTDMFRAGLEWKTPRGILDFHSFRATFATWLNEYGEDIKVIQELMRHSTPIMTLNRYTKANQARQRAAVENLGQMLSMRDTAGHTIRNTRGTQSGKKASDAK